MLVVELRLKVVVQLEGPLLVVVQLEGPPLVVVQLEGSPLGVVLNLLASLLLGQKVEELVAWVLS